MSGLAVLVASVFGIVACLGFLRLNSMIMDITLVLRELDRRLSALERPREPVTLERIEEKE